MSRSTIIIVAAVTLIFGGLIIIDNSRPTSAPTRSATTTDPTTTPATIDPVAIALLNVAEAQTRLDQLFADLPEAMARLCSPFLEATPEQLAEMMTAPAEPGGYRETVDAITAARMLQTKCRNQ